VRIWTIRPVTILQLRQKKAVDAAAFAKSKRPLKLFFIGHCDFIAMQIATRVLGAKDIFLLGLGSNFPIDAAESARSWELCIRRHRLILILELRIRVPT
jgi:hypothetical protein